MLDLICANRRTRVKSVNTPFECVWCWRTSEDKYKRDKNQTWERWLVIISNTIICQWTLKKKSEPRQGARGTIVDTIWISRPERGENVRTKLYLSVLLDTSEIPSKLLSLLSHLKNGDMDKYLFTASVVGRLCLVNPKSHRPLLVPSNIDARLVHVICFDQWDNIKWDNSRGW